jgi:hypothetical protein
LCDYSARPTGFSEPGPRRRSATGPLIPGPSPSKHQAASTDPPISPTLADLPEFPTAPTPSPGFTRIRPEHQTDCATIPRGPQASHSPVFGKALPPADVSPMHLPSLPKRRSPSSRLPVRTSRPPPISPSLVDLPEFPTAPNAPHGVQLERLDTACGWDIAHSLEPRLVSQGFSSLSSIPSHTLCGAWAAFRYPVRLTRFAAWRTGLR